MSEEGVKAESLSEPIAEDGVHLEAEKSIDEQSKMEGGEPPQLSEGDGESESSKQEASERTDVLNEMEASENVGETNGNVKSIQIAEQETSTEEVKEDTPDEALTQVPSCNMDASNEPQGPLKESPPSSTSEEPSAASLEEPSEKEPSEKEPSEKEPSPAPQEEPSTSLQEEPSTAPQELLSTAPQEILTAPVEKASAASQDETQSVTQEQNLDMPLIEPESSTPEDSSVAAQKESQAVIPADSLAATPETSKAVDEGSDIISQDSQINLESEEPSTAPQEGPLTNDVDICSIATVEMAPAESESVVQSEGSCKDSVNNVSTGIEASDSRKGDAIKSNSTKPAPPKVLPKPKYEPPEIKVDLFVKAHASFPNKLGDCPFCHRIMMTLKLKKIGGTVCPVNLNVKSREFEDFCAKHGLPTKVPIIQHGETVICDSNAIADYLDKIRPVPKLVCLSKATNAAGDKVFLKFSTLIKNKIKSNDAKLAQALTDELSRLDTFLSTSPGCFLDGDDLLHPDCILLPKLHHVRIAAKHYKKYEIPENLKYVHSYLAAADKHSVFASTKPSDDAVIEGWRKHAI